MTGRELAGYLRSIADDIELNGHYQGVGIRFEPGRPDGPCCVVMNPTLRFRSATDLRNRSVVIDYMRARKPGTASDGADAIVAWNDRVQTRTVLRQLERWAVEVDALGDAEVVL